MSTASIRSTSGAELDRTRCAARFLRALHAARGLDAARGRAGLACRPARGGGRPLQPGRPSGAQLLLRPIAPSASAIHAPATCPRCAARPTSSWSRSAGRSSCAATGSSRRGGDRCRINRVPGAEGKTKLWRCRPLPRPWRPLAGSRRCRRVGPMTVACLMFNTLQAARRSAGLAFEPV